ncbi:MAG: hypothetical protein OXD30_03500, partial [Bryobacterales bacterium]|nr:hypothetical protein [Bryobacterales bacterium]
MRRCSAAATVLRPLLAALVVSGLPAQSPEAQAGAPVLVTESTIAAAHTLSPVIMADAASWEVRRTRASQEGFDFYMDALVGSFQFGSFGVERALNGLFLPISLPGAFSHGDPAGTNPSAGFLSWSGRALARDVSGSETEGHAVIGEVEISIASYADPRASISLLDLVDLNTGAPRAAIGWAEVPVRDGVFSAVAAGEGVQGRFYGQSHIGAGGIFRADGLAGAFGAQRAHSEVLEGVVVPRGPFAGSSNAATRLMGVVLEGPPVLHEAVLGRQGGWFSPSGPQPLRVHGVVESGEALHGAMSMTVRLDLGFDELPPAALVSRIDTLAGQSGQAGYSVITNTAGFDAPQGDDLLLSGLNATTTLTAGGFGRLANPTGSVGRWSGVLQAEDTSASRWQGNQVRGAVSISVHLESEPKVVVEFSDLAYQGVMRTREDISWTSIPLSKGNFVVKDGANLLQGAFAGADGANVAGIFEWEGLSGGFAASATSRDIPPPPRRQAASSPAAEDVQLLVSAPLLTPAGSGSAAAANAQVAAIERLLVGARPEDPSGVVTEGVQVERLHHAEGAAGNATPSIRSFIRGFGGWLEEGYFGAAGSYSVGEDPVGHRLASAAMMVGTGSASNPPAVDATWAGEMVGIDISRSATDGNLVRGLARVRLSSATHMQA